MGPDESYSPPAQIAAPPSGRSLRGSEASDGASRFKPVAPAKPVAVAASLALHVRALLAFGDVARLGSGDTASVLRDGAVVGSWAVPVYDGPGLLEGRLARRA